MGQAWCKEKTSKAQDSKSPLDRVFVRCAHRIYPGLKEEGSVLGGATQRVTSSEIGYAGSPPREVLTRGRSIDSVDRPFHPSEWVDVNLEVPSTPRPSSVLTNLTVDTSLYPATTPTSSCSNLKDTTPIPPPRRRKRNKGRPLPPKPDEVTENSASNSKHAEATDEPLYSSVQSPRSSGDEQDPEEETGHEEREDAGRKTKEIYEHKVNGTGRIISSDVVSGRKPGRTTETSHYQRKAHEGEEYERFARNRTSKDSSTPNREDKRGPREPEKQMKDTLGVPEKWSGNARSKYSTVSLPNYDELDVARHQGEGTKGHGDDRDRTKSRRPVRSSTGSLPAESFLAPFSEKTSVRLEDYVSRSGSPDNLSSYQVLEKLDSGENGVVDTGFVKYDPSKSEDWDLDGIGDCELNHQRRLSFEDAARKNEGKRSCEDEDVVDFATGRDSERRSPVDRDVAGSPRYLQKPEAFGKTPSPVTDEAEYSEVDPNRSHSRYFDPPTMPDSCRISANRDTVATKEPFFLDEAKHRSALDTIGGSCGAGESDRSDQSRMIFGRSLSNESEPEEDAYESKELTSDRRPVSLIRTISEESLPREMLEQQDLDDFFDEKLAKDVHNKLKKSLDDRQTSTPPPSPEPRIGNELVDGDHSTLLKVLKEEAAEESNLSSMTPSLTELEVALSDMLEKEEAQEAAKDDGRRNGSNELIPGSLPNPEIVPIGRNLGCLKSDEINRSGEAAERTADQIPIRQESEKNQVPVSLGQILEDRKPITGRKVSFCAWEETAAETETPNDREFTERPTDLDKNVVSRLNDDRGWVPSGQHVARPADTPPEKPSRLHRTMDELFEGPGIVPTPPRRRNKSLGVAKREIEAAQNGSVIVDPYANDRLI
ncbi:uncharacterized protein LOC122395197 [Colletes gigas]|uniref:uncharacterized protein LOC122395197 n=1 Tax=Colletes gigas TaxID=935657 RepID=UPI001C9AF75D|nr:uncharacterized protein LOC122395197 [Colletes gigas]XP_043248530.1 uncharacterized protein LOC122395197 [Colletes gigas]